MEGIAGHSQELDFISRIGVRIVHIVKFDGGGVHGIRDGEHFARSHAHEIRIAFRVKLDFQKVAVAAPCDVRKGTFNGLALADGEVRESIGIGRCLVDFSIADGACMGNAVNGNAEANGLVGNRCAGGITCYGLVIEGAGGLGPEVDC